MSAAVSPSGWGASARLRLLTAVLAAAALLGGSASCGSSSSHTLTSPSGSRCGLQIQADSAAFSPEGGPGAARVSATRECTWSARAEAPWLTLSSPATGQGEGTIQFTVAANSDPSTRTGGIEINDQRVQVSQAGTPCDLRLSSRQEFLDIRGGERRIHITSSSRQCRWVAVPDRPWITVLSGSEGSGDGTVTFGVSAAATVPRTGTLTIAGQVVQVEQVGPTVPGAGCSYAVSATSVSLGADGGSGEVLVSAPGGCAWSAESHVPWITVSSGTAGSGAGLVRFDAAPAAGAAARVGTLAVAGHLVTVSQSPECRHSVDPPAFNVPDTGGAGAIAIRTGAGCGWSAASTVAWATITAGGTGSGPGEVRFSVAASTGPARTGTIRIGSEVATIAQAPGCAFTVSPTATAPASAAGGSGSIQIAGGAGCAWTAASHSAWVTLTAAAGTGSGQVGYSVAANAGPARQATLTIAGRTVTVAQANGCTYGISPSQDVAPAGGAGAVSVATAAGCPWAAASSAGWLTLPTPSGVGPGEVPFTAAPNAGPPRGAIVTVAGQPATVNQASTCTWRFAPPSHEFSASGGGGTALVIVDGTCTWTAVSTADWITVTVGSEGAGNGLVQFTAAPNPGPARSGSITIAGTPYVVVQRAP